MNLHQLLDLDFKKFERDMNVKLKSVLSNMTAPSAEKSRSRTKSKSSSKKKDFIRALNKDRKVSDLHLQVDKQEDRKSVGKSTFWKSVAIKTDLFRNITTEPKSGKKKEK